MNSDTVSKNSPRPFVSVICPILDARKYIDRLMDGLVRQSYPAERFEVIAVDNGSTDGTAEIVSQYPVRLEFKPEFASSYFARNHGVKCAIGNVYAFIDADCVPDEDWIRNGVRALDETASHLVAGKVAFAEKQSPTAWEVYDSIAYMDNERCVMNGHAKTANLFTRASLFDRIGCFRGDVTSGGDVEWTSRAVAHGYTLAFDPSVLVVHPVRNARESLTKTIRVGKGKRTAVATSKFAWLKLLFRVATCVIPVDFLAIHRRLRADDEPLGMELSVYLVSIVLRVTGTLGVLLDLWGTISARTKKA